MKHMAVSRPRTLHVQGVQGIFEKNLSKAPFSFSVCVRACMCAHMCVSVRVLVCVHVPGILIQFSVVH